MTVALIDGDILLYKAAAAAEQEHRWPDGIWSYQADEKDGEDIVLRLIEGVKEALGTDKFVFCVSDAHNYRKSVLPTYKGNRKNVRRPLILKHLQEWSKTMPEYFSLPMIEADDVMGILATCGKYKDPVIVTIDKDLRQVPARNYNPETEEFYHPTPAEGERLFYLQTLMGDPTDGYAGCPSIGRSGAEKILDDPHKLVKYEHVFKTGARKGLSEMRWKRGDICSVWKAIVSNYEKQGLTEEDALVQARCARILTAELYDIKTKTFTLWSPK